MPPFFFITIALIFLSPPLYGLLVVLLDRRHRPHERNILALGGGVLIQAGNITLLAGLGALLNGQALRWLPLLLIWAAAWTAYRLIQTGLLKLNP